MNYSDLTDKVLEALDNPLLNKLEELLPAYEKALAASSGKTLTPQQLQENQEIRKTEVKKIAGELLSVQQHQLSSLVPEAAFWYDHHPQPNSEWIWASDPFSHAFMGKMTMGISLMHRNELKLSILWMLDTQILYTGVINEGSYARGIQLKVSDKNMTASSYAMNYIIEDAHSTAKPDNNLIVELKNKFGFNYMINKIPENITASLCHVAEGKNDFTSVQGKFSYPSIAAAIGVAQYAGAVVSDFSGGTEKLFKGEELFCSNRNVHQAMIEVGRK